MDYIETELYKSLDNTWFESKQYSNVMENNSKYKVVALDPGFKIFLTYYCEDDGYGYIGINVMDGIYRGCKKIDKLQQKIDGWRLRNKSCRKLMKTIERKRKKVYNLLNDLHIRVANYLSRTYNLILIPDISLMGKYNTSSILARNDQYDLETEESKEYFKICFDKFLKILFRKCKENRSYCKIVSEFNSTKTCSNCKNMDFKMNSRTYTCNKCGIKIDRDLNAAMNILSFNKMD